MDNGVTNPVLDLNVVHDSPSSLSGHFRGDELIGDIRSDEELVLDVHEVLRHLDCCSTVISDASRTSRKKCTLQISILDRMLYLVWCAHRPWTCRTADLEFTGATETQRRQLPRSEVWRRDQ